MNFSFSGRVQSLPPYIFSEINRLKAEAVKQGASLLSLAIGNPDQPTPADIVQKIQEAVAKPSNHLYSPYEGTLGFRRAASRWLERRFSVRCDPETEVVALIGSKEGIAHFPLAFCNPGDKVLFPSPGYPIFQTCGLLANAVPIAIPHLAENGFLPNISVLEALVREHRPKMMILNYPNNPTTAVCPKELLSEIVAIARRYEVITVYDNAYSEMFYAEGVRPPSLLEIPGAKEIGIELHSLSKTFNMTGWRLGFAAGNAQLIRGLLQVKTNIDSGPLLAIQEAGEFALTQGETLSAEVRKVYEPRRRFLLSGLERLGIEYFHPAATFFVWARVPAGESSMDFAKGLIENQGLVVTPGVGFGPEGEGFFRLALTVSHSQLEEALHRLENYLSAKSA